MSLEEQLREQDLAKIDRLQGRHPILIERTGFCPHCGQQISYTRNILKCPKCLMPLISDPDGNELYDPRQAQRGIIMRHRVNMFNQSYSIRYQSKEHKFPKPIGL